MKRFRKIAVCLAGSLVLDAGLHAGDLSLTNNPLANNPYAPIVVRNVFGLNPPPNPDAGKANEMMKDLPKITATGIYAAFDHWKVLFKTTGGDKHGKPAKDAYYDLAEGQRQDDIEVTSIDAKNSLVTFNNHGVMQEIPLASADASSTGSSGGGDHGGQGFSSSGNNNMRASGGIIRFGNRGANGEPNRPGMNSNYNGASGNPDGGLNFGNSSGNRVYQPPAPNMSPEDAAVIIAAEHLKAQQDGDPTAPLYPPTSIDKEAGITGSGTGNSNP